MILDVEHHLPKLYSETHTDIDNELSISSQLRVSTPVNSFTVDQKVPFPILIINY